ncbi:hypothetical protein XBKB1_3050012 [Xenorhabdus bovienii str. kraussei Becker Underwood]|uniref:Uncharacterized protein n=1 Tax=Xenorhabdus bovienii str. kraussei Becker Underwood TaxID=1398204 RepID=A0A077PUS6_XENBV|nr:hypothetical protein XBKB1_3050012 [Xenorhabdus bovienii str. kraussei Becker Underwood]
MSDLSGKTGRHFHVCESATEESCTDIAYGIKTAAGKMTGTFLPDDTGKIII